LFLPRRGAYQQGIVRSLHQLVDGILPMPDNKKHVRANESHKNLNEMPLGWSKDKKEIHIVTHLFILPMDDSGRCLFLVRCVPFHFFPFGRRIVQSARFKTLRRQVGEWQKRANAFFCVSQQKTTANVMRRERALQLWEERPRIAEQMSVWMDHCQYSDLACW
jgi:hypothetical protein